MSTEAMPRDLIEQRVIEHPPLISDEEYTDDTIPLSLEEDVSEPTFQSDLINYLSSVLRLYFTAHNWFIVSNLAIYPPRPHDKYDHTDPDLAIFIGTPQPETNIQSWRVQPPKRPAPTVVFEIASRGTWRKDIDDKPVDYARIGAEEYYAYDPNARRLWGKGAPRLRGWLLTGGRIREVQPDAQGRIWSVALNSYLVPDGKYLRLTDRNGIARPSEKENSDLQKAIAEEQRNIARKERIIAAEKEAALRAREEALERAKARLRALGENVDDL